MAVVLLVEDDIFVRELAEEIIQEFGHQTHSASDMDEALLFLRSRQHVDALVADIRLGTDYLGGLELARQAITLRPQLRVLYTTGSAINKFAGLFVEAYPVDPCCPKCSILSGGNRRPPGRLSMASALSLTEFQKAFPDEASCARLPVRTALAGWLRLSGVR